MIGWVLVGVWAALRFARLRLPTRPTRCVAGRPAISRFKIRRWQALLGERPGSVGCWGWRGGLGSGWWGWWCVLSSAGHRRQSGTCREVKRRRLVAVLMSASRRWTSRQNPDRASPARPRREHTPRGSAWAAPGPGPCGPVGEGSYITLMRQPRSRGRPVTPMKDTAPPSGRSSQLLQRPRTPAGSGNFLEFLFRRKGRIRLICRWRRLEWKRIGEIWTCGGRCCGRGGAGDGDGAGTGGRGRAAWDRTRRPAGRPGVWCMQHRTVRHER